MRDTIQATRELTANIANENYIVYERDNVDADQGLRFDITMLTTGAVTGTVQWFLQDSSDGGKTWDDVIASNTFAFGASVTTQRFSVALSVAAAFTQGSAVSDKALSAGTVRVGPLGSKVRIVEKISSISGTPTGPQYRLGLTIK